MILPAEKNELFSANLTMLHDIFAVLVFTFMLIGRENNIFLNFFINALLGICMEKLQLIILPAAPACYEWTL